MTNPADAAHLIRAKKKQIAALRRKAETGADWADICVLADEVVALGGKI